MDPLIGAAIAVLVAWVSILVAVALPWRPPIQGLRRAGALALVTIALMIWGVPVPSWVPLVVLVVGVLVASLRPRGQDA